MNKGDLGLKILKSRYFYKEEKSYADLIDRMLSVIPDNQSEKKEKLREAMQNYYFVPSTPVLTNLGTGQGSEENSRGLPISCFISEFDDDMTTIINTFQHNSFLSAGGGGVGTSFDSIRENGSPISNKGNTAGIFPFLNIQDSVANGIQQGSIRGGSTVINIDIDHPEIEEFIRMRLVEEGTDLDRKFPRLHHTVNITDNFMKAVINDEEFDLISRYDGSVAKSVKAFDLFMDLLEVRFKRGEPNIVFKDNVKKNRSLVYQLAGITAKQSNLCLEILLDTSPDMTAVCCLGSLNLALYEHWKDDDELFEAILYFLDRVLEETLTEIDKEKDPIKRLSLERVKRFILNDRSIGLGVMGLHTFLQSKSIPLESSLAVSQQHRIFNDIHGKAEEANIRLGRELGACPNAAKAGIYNRFSNVTAIAPTASISHIAGSVSPGIDPIMTNYNVIGQEEGYTTWRNPNLIKLINKYAEDNGLSDKWVEDQWTTILENEGSVQHLDWMSEWDKDVFKTAFELDMNWLVELASARIPYIDQSQSLNLFFPAGIDINYLFNVHVKAWSSGVKTLYYCRTTATSRANDTGKGKTTNKAIEKIINQENKYDECLACQ